MSLSVKYSPMTLLRNTDLVIAGLCLVILSGITFVSIFTRYFFHEPFMFLEEMQKALMVWITMLSGSACFRYKQHVMVDVIVDMFSPRWSRIMQIMMVAVVTAVLGFVVYYGTKLCLVHYNADRVTNVLHMKVWLIYSVVPVSALAMIYQCIRYELLGLSLAENKEKEIINE